MITIREYRQMAEECFSWARKAQTDEVRLYYVNLAQTRLDAANWVKDRSRPSPQRKSGFGQPSLKRKAA